jgi:hypothetical protein
VRKKELERVGEREIKAMTESDKERQSQREPD